MLHQILTKLLNNQWPIILGAGLYTTCPWWASVSIHQAKCNIPTLRPYREKMYTTFLNDAEILRTYGCVLWCSQIVYIHPYSLDTTTAFDFVTECLALQCLFGWGRVQATILPYFTWPWPGLDSVSYSECSVVPSATGYWTIALRKCL